MMPTQEERLSTVERTVTWLRDTIYDLSHNETMLLGMAMKQGEIVREIRASLAAFEQGVNQRFEALDGRFEALDGRFQTLEGRFEQRFTSLEQRFDRLEKLILDRLPPSQG